MDDNTRQVLVALASAFGGLATGIVVAKLGFGHARDTDRERWQREDAIRREELDRARRERWLDRRREVCVTVAGTAMALNQMAVSHRAGHRVKVNDYFPLLRSGFASTAELRLISEALVQRGGDLMIAANQILLTATTQPRASLDSDEKSFHDALAAFLEAAEAELRSP